MSAREEQEAYPAVYSEVLADCTVLPIKLLEKAPQTEEEASL